MAIYVNDINTVYITGAGYTRKAFTGLGRDSMGWNETVWAGNLTRSNTFALENIDDVEMGQVPQCTLVFKYIKIEDFIILQRLLKERHLIVDYFDFDLGQRVTHEMAITGNERKKVHSLNNYINGICDFTIKLVGTNRDFEYVDLTITYEPNGATSGSSKTTTNTVTQQVTLDNGSDFYKSGYHIKEWNTKADGTGQSYGLNQSITLWQSMTLYAIWE